MHGGMDGRGRVGRDRRLVRQRRRLLAADFRVQARRTDGVSFYTDYDGGQYVIRDYWDEDVLQTISQDATLDTFDFVNPFAAEIGWMK